MRQIGTIHPGMKRQDLNTVFHTEGGKSTRFQHTYVSLECPYIKVDIRFKVARGDTDALRDDPEDIIEFASRPPTSIGASMISFSQKLP